VFFNDLDIQRQWLQVLKAASGYSSLFDYYSVGEDIAAG
jgi:hypothetical protein